MMTDKAISTLSGSILAGLLCACPRCGKGKLFRGFLTLRPHCEVCGLDYGFADAGDGPAVFIILFAGFIVVAAALIMAYALTGFAVLHTLTLALKNRSLWLSCAYAVVIVFSWPVLVIAALGLADAVFGFRQRYLQGRPPPVPAP